MLVKRRKRRKNHQKDLSLVSSINNFLLLIRRYNVILLKIVPYYMQRRQNKSQHLPQLVGSQLSNLMITHSNLHRMVRVMQQLADQFIIRYTEMLSSHYILIFVPFNRLYTNICHVHQAYTASPMQPNQIYMHPNMHTMPLCTPQVL
jgi:hypothetical protein